MVGKVMDARAKPEVMIVGAGLAGLLLAQLLEQIDVPYHVFERATAVKPLGYQTIIFSRPKLYELMLSRVPPHKISHGKKVIRTQDDTSLDGRVTIHCADGTSYTGDILVGADGAYSFVRQDLYKRLSQRQEQGPGADCDIPLVPASDLEEMNIGFSVMAGVAEPEDPKEFPQLNDPFCHFSGVVEGSGCRAPMPMPKEYGEKPDGSGNNRNHSSWDVQTTSQSIDDMIQEFKDMPCPWGGTMGNAIRSTPRDRISKVVLEEKLFQTWHGGRTVLIGDACHKILTGAGLGAVNAMLDAVVLANCIYNITEVVPSSITSVFEEYYKQRYPRLHFQFKRSQMMTSVMGGQMYRHVLLNLLPKWVHDWGFVKSFEYRPQIAWLPLVPNRGQGQVLPQEGPRKVLEKYAH
ncbi:hypothetical protein B0O80DRAFT_504137 [Mortierella sp. GBAus27b]|nr:hypothetical protein B0O80DRAFT_504137 [Mortierella sp. GBAus27b]